MTTKKISTINAVFLIGAALLFDGIQFVLTLTVIGTVAAWFVSAFAWILFLIWFALLGTNYFDKGAGTKILTVFASVIAELMPLVNALPGITLGVVALIVQNRIAHAKESAVAPKAASAGARRPRRARTQPNLRGRAAPRAEEAA